MIVLGLDPGIARTGFGVLDTARPELFVRCGCLTTPSTLATADRLYLLAQDIEELIAQHRPDQAVLETVFFGKNTTTALLTAETRGVLTYLLRRAAIPVHNLTPPQIKSRLTGYGAATKLQMQRVITDRLRLTTLPQPDDAADGLAAALCFIQATVPLPARVM